MAKRITAKVGQYEKDGQTKGQYVEIGALMSNQNGEFILLSPTVDLAGVLMQQRILAQVNGKKAGDRVMCSIFDSDNRQQQPNQQKPANNQGNFDSDIPFNSLNSMIKNHLM